MLEKITNYWQELSGDNKRLIQQIAVASIALYVAFQLLGLFFPVLITGCACYWVYKKVLA